MFSIPGAGGKVTYLCISHWATEPATSQARGVRGHKGVPVPTCRGGWTKGRISWPADAAEQKSSTRQLLHQQQSGPLFFIPIFETGQGLLAQGKKICNFSGSRKCYCNRKWGFML